jgi:DNA-directed RNA polymerase beta subunit
MEGPTNKDSLVLLKTILNERGVDYHHISTYNHEVEQNLRNLYDVIIDPIELRSGLVLHVRLGNVYFKPPILVEDDKREVALTPKLARARCETYAAGMYVDVHVFTARTKDIDLLPETIKMGFLRRKAKSAFLMDDYDSADAVDGVNEIELAPGITHYVCPRMFLTTFPIMVGSRLCRLYGLPIERLIELGELIHEPGGYFIMRGKERVIVTQKNMSKNFLYVAKDVPAGQENTSGGGQVIYTGTIHCCGEANDAQRVVNKIIIGHEKEYQDLVVRLSITQIYAGKGVPIGLILAALGMSDWQTVLETIAAFARLEVEIVSKYLHASHMQARDAFSEVDADHTLTKYRAAWNWLSEKVSIKQRIKPRDPLPIHPTEPRKTAAYSVIHYWLYPHIMDGIPPMQTADDYWAICRIKAYTLCMHVASVLRVCIGLDEETDRDRMDTKRWESPGTLFMTLFRTYLRPQMSDFRSQIMTMDKNKKPIDILSAMCSERLQKGLSSGLQTGKFTISKRSGGQSQQSAAQSASTGVSQPHARLNPSSAAAHLRKAAAPGSRKTPANARELHTTQWGYLCVAPDTLVSRGPNYDQISLQELAISNDDSDIVVVDPETRQATYSKVIAFQKFERDKYPSKTILRVTTNTGRSITATGDHLFYSDQGEISAENIKLGMRLLTTPTSFSTTPRSDFEEPHILMTMSDFMSIGAEKDVATINTIQKDAHCLALVGLLPVMSNDKRLVSLARMLGYLNTDGHLTYQAEFYMGEKDDALTLQQDANDVYEKCASDPIFRETIHVDHKTGKTTTHHTWRVNITGPLGRLLMALGGIIGKKSKSSVFNVPTFVIRSGLSVQRAYLSGLFGGDGSALWYHNDSDSSRPTSRFKLDAPRFMLTKDKEQLSYGMSLIMEVKNMMNNLGIDTSDVVVISKQKEKCMLQFSVLKTDKAMLTFCDMIGYAYCRQKQHKAAIISEYIRYRIKTIETTEKNQDQALKLFTAGVGPFEIAQMLQLSIGVVRGWIDRRNVILKSKTYLPYSALKVDEFIRSTSACIDTGTLYTEVVSVERVYDCPIVMDLTTESDVHTFVANGFVTHNCPFETPEGQPCGIQNHLAMLCYISCEYSSKILIDWLRTNVKGIVPIYDPSFNPRDWTIIVNSRIAFSYPCDDENEEQLAALKDWITEFKNARFSGELPRDVSISIPRPELREIRCFCDGGRLNRPLCVVNDGQLAITKNDINMARITGMEDLFRYHKIELIDGAEAEDTYVATYFSDTLYGEYFTHCEVNPVSILGTSAGVIPFAERNQSPRNVYQSAMGKQAFGTPSIPLYGNMRPTDHVLEHTEHPLVDTVLQNVENMSFEWMPCGVNCVVFVDAYAYNVEDSLVMNQDSIEAGLLSSYTDRTYIQTAQRNTHHNTMESEIFEKPSPENTASYKTEALYDKIGSDGLPVPGESVTDETIIIGKTGPLPTPPQDPTSARRNRSIDRTHMYTDPNHSRKDLSTLPRKKGGGMIMEVVVSHTRDTKRASVTIRHHRKPQIGDKFSSRHGQKGIAAKICRSDELPVTLDGTHPDIVINPHAFPSRMTGAQTTESMLGKIGAVTGTCRDGTVFFGPSKDNISKELYMLKLDPDSEQRVIDPKTGELMESAIYTGMVYYQCLKHLVEDKVHARNRGPVTKLNKQPVEGRRREGGLRIGEMEKETMIAHGAAQLALERTCEVSDAFRVPVCMTCGSIAHREKTNHVSHYCKNCDKRENIRVETLPYVLKQFFSYLLPCGIDSTLIYGGRAANIEDDAHYE